VSLFREALSGENSWVVFNDWFSFLLNVSPKATLKTFLYFCLHGASTALTLQHELNMPEATVYRTLTKLRSLGIVVSAIKISKHRNSKGGPRSTVWALESSSTDENVRALQLHTRWYKEMYK